MFYYYSFFCIYIYIIYIFSCAHRKLIKEKDSRKLRIWNERKAVEMKYMGKKNTHIKIRPADDNFLSLTLAYKYCWVKEKKEKIWLIIHLNHCKYNANIEKKKSCDHKYIENRIKIKEENCFYCVVINS